MKRLIVASLGLALLSGCTPSKKESNPSDAKGANASNAKTPVFSLAWSEYPSWSIFGVAEVQGLLDGAEGKLGAMEKKWKVDIVLKQVDYDTCIGLYGSNQTDAVCITNMDTLGPAGGRSAVCVLPTSTSVGADACIAVGVDSIDALAGKVTRGLEKSVSQYAFERLLIHKGKKPADYPFENMDPAAAATAMQTGDSKVQSIMVWNPFVLDTVRKQKNAKVLFDSSEIPEEIIDMVVIGKDSLAKSGGDAFAHAIIDTYYEMNRRLADPKTGDSTLVEIGKKFSDLGLEDMKLVVQQTRFYKSPDEALKLLESEKFRNETMPAVVKFCVEHKIVEQAPSVGFAKADASVNFESKYIQQVRDQASK